MKNKRAAEFRQFDGVPLGRIRPYGRKNVRRRGLVFGRDGGVAFLFERLVCKHCRDEFVFGKFADVTAKIFPHLIARKSESSEEYVICNRPVFHACDFHSYHRKHFGNFQTLQITVQPAHVYVVFAFKVFEQREVDRTFFVARDEFVTYPALARLYLDGLEHQRSILFVAVAAPFKHAVSKIQYFTARFLVCLFVLFVQFYEYFGKVLVVFDGAQNSAARIFGKQFFYPFQLFAERERRNPRR